MRTPRTARTRTSKQSALDQKPEPRSAHRLTRGGARATLILLQLLHRPVGVIDGGIGVSVCACVRVCDRQPPERFASYFARRLPAFQPELVGERIVFIRVAVRPAVDRDFQDVARGVESARTQYARQLLANVALVSFERRAIELDAPQLMLLARRASRLAGCLHHVHYDRLVRLFRTFIAADADRKIQADARVVHAGRINRTRA